MPNEPFETPQLFSYTELPNPTKKYLDASGEWSAPFQSIEIKPSDLELQENIEPDLNDLFEEKYLDRFFYALEDTIIKNKPSRRVQGKTGPIKSFYLRTYTVVPGMCSGQLIIDEENCVWVRTKMNSSISDWAMIYASDNYEAVSTSGGGGGDGNGELDDLTIKCGSFNNEGSGWQKYTFPDYFEDIPQVFCNCSEYHVDIKDVTPTDFQYRVYSYSGSSKSDQSSTSLVINWFAIEYGGD